jgi:alkylated DNA repair protein (DNA oxidative demethylase)
MEKVEDDFYFIPNYFSSSEQQCLVKKMINLGIDPIRGFHSPDLKPHRFNPKPKYPVKKYMCLGLYWNPLDYLYYDYIPKHHVVCHPIEDDLKLISEKVIKLTFPVWEKTYKPEAILVNYYLQKDKMGWHTDKEERDLKAPVIGISLGSEARFQYENKKGEKKNILLPSGSIYVFAESARLMRHSIAHVYTKTLPEYLKELLAPGERISLTIRKVFV